MSGRVIILVGIPGAGKSTYGRHLAEDLGVAVVRTDDNSGVLNERVDRPEGFVERHRPEDHDVVIEWGFMPCYLPQIRVLKAEGAVLVWFRSDVERCRRDWAMAWEMDLADPMQMRPFNDQIRRIREAGLPTTEFQVVHVFTDGSRKRPEEIDIELGFHG